MSADRYERQDPGVEDILEVSGIEQFRRRSWFVLFSFLPKGRFCIVLCWIQSRNESTEDELSGIVLGDDLNVSS